jgi:hypothetical protein
MLCFTPSVPALPLITRYAAKDDLLKGLRNGLAAACRDPELSAIRKTLMLRDIRLLPLSAYGCIAEMEKKAIGSGYRQVA